jgi:anti-sigma regulatory factor (Ser/Thr protein kinase)
VVLRTELTLDPAQVSRARHLVASQLADWDINGEPGEVAVLLVSELVTNALRHGGPPIGLTAAPTASGVRVEVSDSNGEAFPVLMPIEPDLPGGRGLRLVDALADRWGTTELDGGKCVWFEVEAPDKGR